MLTSTDASTKLVSQEEAKNTSSSTFNPIRAEKLDDWKKTIKNLRHFDTFGDNENWMVDWRTTGGNVSFVLGDEGPTSVPYIANFIDISAKKQSGDIVRVELYSIAMNVAEFRELGAKLHVFLALDPTEFLLWCDKVGNQWLDAPLFSSKSSRFPNSRKFYGFNVHRTYDDEKPWYAEFVITDP